MGRNHRRHGFIVRFRSFAVDPCQLKGQNFIFRKVNDVNRACRIIIIVCVLVMGAIGSVHAKGKTSLSAWVPYEALGVVVVNHQRLSMHPSYADIKRVLAEQRVGQGFSALSQVKSVEPTGIQKVLSFRVPGLGEGTLIRGVINIDLVRQHAQSKLAEGYSEGLLGERPWFSLTSDLRMYALSSTGVFAIGPKAVMERVVNVGTGKGFEKRSSLKAIKREVSEGSPLAWGVSYLSKAQKQRLFERGAENISHVERTYFRISGTDRLDVKVKVLASDPGAAQKVAETITQTIRQRIIGTTWMKLLGIAAVAKRITVTTEGSEVLLGLQLTAGQVGLICKSGSRLVAALRH